MGGGEREMKDGMRMEVNRAFSEWRVEEGREGEVWFIRLRGQNR